MNVEFLAIMQQNLELPTSHFSMEGLPDSRIIELEKEINNGNTFPKAFREYLFLGGEYNGLDLDPIYNCDHGNGVEFIEAKLVYQEIMKKEGKSLDRPYALIHSHNGDGFGFIYLDEGDDPQPYHFAIYPEVMVDGKTIFKYPESSFTKLIERLVDSALKGVMPW